MKTFATFFNIKSFQSIVLAVTTALLASCAASEKAVDNKPSASSNTTAKSIETKANFSKKLNACAVVPQAEVEKILGSAVKSAELSRVTEGTATTAAFSTCTYKLENNQQIEFFARRSPVADNTPEAWQKLYDTMKGFGALTDVAEVGDKAFWAGKMKQLHVFAGENIYIYISANNFKTEAEAKTKSIEFARQALPKLL